MSEKDRESSPNAELEKLFDQTAEEPSDIERARLLARAERLGATRRKQPWMSPSVVVPGALAAAAAIVFFVHGRGTTNGEPDRGDRAIVVPTVSPRTEPTAEAASEVEDVTASTVASDDLALEVLADDAEDLDWETLLAEDDLNELDDPGM